MKRFWLLLLLPSLLLAKPKGCQVVSGTAEVQHSGSHTSIQASDRAIIHWEEFSISSGEKTQFIQPNARSAVLNRVSQGISQIDGLLEANGRVYLVNPRGVVIGKDGVVKTAGFVAYLPRLPRKLSCHRIYRPDAADSYPWQSTEQDSGCRILPR